MFIRALQTVAAMLIMIGIGFFFAYKQWLSEDGNRLLSSLVVKVGMPGVIISNIMTAYTRSNLLPQLSLLAAPVLAYVIGIPAALWLARAFKIREGRRGVFVCLAAFSNSVFIGFPVTRAVLGESAIPFATLYYLANTVAFWTVGSPLIRRDADSSPSSFADTLKRVFNAPLTTLFASLALVLLGVKLPDFLTSAAGTVGNLVTPLSMIFIGSMLHRVWKAGVKWEHGFAPLLGARFLLAPAIMLACCVAAGVDGLTRQSYFLQAGMSSMTQVAIVAHSYGADGEYASLGVALTTLALMVMLPVFALIMQYWM